jgi:hypothetical protein
MAVVDSSSMKRKRRDRTIFTTSALTHLEGVFRINPYPDVDLREHLAETLNIPEARIMVNILLKMTKFGGNFHLNTFCDLYYRNNGSLLFSDLVSKQTIQS